MPESACAGPHRSISGRPRDWRRSIGAFPQAQTAWVSFPNRYRARCRNEGGSSWLHADALGGAADKRPVLAYAPTPGWGLHLWDVNIALGNLVGLVKSESAVWLDRR